VDLFASVHLLGVPICLLLICIDDGCIRLLAGGCLYCEAGLWYWLSDGSRIINNHFIDDSLLTMRVEQDLVDMVLTCLDTFFFGLGVMVSALNTIFWFFGMDSLLDWIPVAWSYVHLGPLSSVWVFLFGLVYYQYLSRNGVFRGLRASFMCGTVRISPL
jgi:hypothetical protein